MIKDCVAQNEIENVLRSVLDFPENSDQILQGIYEKIQKDKELSLYLLLKDLFCNLLNQNVKDVERDIPMVEYGMDSILFMEMFRILKKNFDFIDITSFISCNTLGDIAENISVHVEADTLDKFISKQDEIIGMSRQSQPNGTLSGLIVDKKNCYSSDEIESMRQKELNGFIHLTKEELVKRQLSHNTDDLPIFETFDLMIDKRNCLWIIFKAKVIGDMALGEMLIFQTIFIENIRIKCIPIIYFTHYGDHFSLGGDRISFAESILKEEDGFAKWFEKYKLLSCANIKEDFPLQIAVCAGTAQGGGFELLLSCDFQFVLPQIKIGLPEIKSGLYAGMGGISYLATQVGLARTKLLNITGNLMYGHEAYEIGLVSHLSLDPFHDAYLFYEAIPDINIAKHVNFRLNQQYKEIRNQDAEDWFRFVKTSIKSGYKHIVEDYQMLSSQ